MVSIFILICFLVMVFVSIYTIRGYFKIKPPKSATISAIITCYSLIGMFILFLLAEGRDLYAFLAMGLFIIAGVSFFINVAILIVNRIKNR
jgi:hypothetical protein